MRYSLDHRTFDGYGSQGSKCWRLRDRLLSVFGRDFTTVLQGIDMICADPEIGLIQAEIPRPATISGTFFPPIHAFRAVAVDSIKNPRVLQ